MAVKNSAKKNTAVKRSIDLTPETLDSLKRTAAAQHTTVSEIIRKYIDQGLNVDKTKGDIDFIRTNIREELDLIIKPQINRLAKMLMRIGVMTISSCFFTSKIVYHFVPFSDKEAYDKLMKEAKHNAAAYLSVRDSTLEEAFKEFDKNNT